LLHTADLYRGFLYINLRLLQLSVESKICYVGSVGVVVFFVAYVSAVCVSHCGVVFCIL